MRLGVVLSTCLVFSSAYAGPDDAEWNPPARYDHPYYGKLRIYQFSRQPDLVEACHAFETEGNYFVGDNQRGCAWWSDDHSKCIVFILDKSFNGQTPKAVLRHEIGHCNGWGANHPD